MLYRMMEVLILYMSSAKLLKGPWTHCPDTAFVGFVLERCSACCELVRKVRPVQYLYPRSQQNT